MFHRVCKTHEGTGIGLALVRKNVERMGGRVGLDSEPGKGSLFWVELQKASCFGISQSVQEQTS
jgi:signal transduction histidine kinase